MDERYSRQILFSGIGDEGQRRLLAARVLIVGCGALGSAHAESLARAGAGHLRIVDRDFVEPSNLQRQTMFTESDAEQRLPKAIAAANHLRQINSEIEIEPHILDINYSSVERLLDGCDLVIDAVDRWLVRVPLVNTMAWASGVRTGVTRIIVTRAASGMAAVARQEGSSTAPLSRRTIRRSRSW